MVALVDSDDSKRALLTDEAIDYLRRFAPIGCRDWTTVDILLSIDSMRQDMPWAGYPKPIAPNSCPT